MILIKAIVQEKNVQSFSSLSCVISKLCHNINIGFSKTKPF